MVERVQKEGQKKKKPGVVGKPSWRETIRLSCIRDCRGGGENWYFVLKKDREDRIRGSPRRRERSGLTCALILVYGNEKKIAEGVLGRLPEGTTPRWESFEESVRPVLR